MKEIRILANDGIDASARQALQAKGIEVDSETISQENLGSRIGEYDGLLVRSATKVTSAIMDAGLPRLKFIGRAGVGLDNIDTEYAHKVGLSVANTPSASSQSVAELSIAHLFTLCRMLQVTNRIMPSEGQSRFKELKKTASNGIELGGKTLGIIGLGRIGQSTAKLALGLGMKVIGFDPFVNVVSIPFHFHPFYTSPEFRVDIKSILLDDVLGQSDFISLHVPSVGKPIIGERELSLMKSGAGLVNCSRGGTVDEKALFKALKEGKLAFAGLDVFESEPPVYLDILGLSNVSLSPHIGASTIEAQQRIGEEMAAIIIKHFTTA